MGNQTSLRDFASDLLAFLAQHHCKSRSSPAPAVRIAATMLHGVTPNAANLRAAIAYLSEIDTPRDTLERLRMLSVTAPGTEHL